MTICIEIHRPLLVAHTPIDVVAFCGYLLLAGHVSWLPLPR